MEIVRTATAGTVESSDIYVEVSPGTGLSIELSSAVLQQFGESIRDTMTRVAEELQVRNVHIRAHDRGALDCTIRARLETALRRAGELRA
jgi:citrate lyase subunit gamma (acyl carrier protein)